MMHHHTKGITINSGPKRDKYIYIEREKKDRKRKTVRNKIDAFKTKDPKKKVNIIWIRRIHRKCIT